MKTEIRPAEVSDLSDLARLSRETISASYRAFLGDEAVEGFIGSGWVEQYLDENVDRCSVIVWDGRLAGLAVHRGSLIDLMMIHHTLHRRGLGTRLLESVEEALFRDYAELTLESFEENRPANDFYRKNGWREVSRCLDESSGVNKILFHKTAAPPLRQTPIREAHRE